MWWLTKVSTDNVDIFHLYAQIGNDERTEMQLKFQDSRNPSVSGTTPKVGGTGLHLTTANHAVMMQKFLILNEQWPGFAQVVRLVQNPVPHTWVLNAGSVDYYICARDFHIHSSVAQMRVLHGFMRLLNITTSMIHQILHAPEDHSKKLEENADTLQS